LIKIKSSINITPLGLAYINDRGDKHGAFFSRFFVFRYKKNIGFCMTRQRAGERSSPLRLSAQAAGKISFKSAVRQS